MQRDYLFAKDNLDSFVNKIESVFYNSFDLGQKEVVEQEDCILLSVQFSEQQMMEYVVDELEQKFTTKILYATKTVDGGEYFAVAYSEPYEDKMYVVFLTSDAFGISDNMVVRFYDSVDVMFADLMRLWTDRVNLGVTLEIATKRELIMDFI